VRKTGGRRKFIAVLGFLALACFFLAQIQQSPVRKAGELKLSSFPEAFGKSTLIIIGDNASETEVLASRDIAEYLLERTGSRPEIKKCPEIGKRERREYNLIVIGTPESNKMLREIYEISEALGVNESFPGEGKSVLEILPNPWNKDRAMLLVEGENETPLLLVKCALICCASAFHESFRVIVFETLEDFFSLDKLDPPLKRMLPRLCLSGFEQWNGNVSVIVQFERELSEEEIRKMEREYGLKFERLPDGSPVKIGKSYNIHIPASRLIDFASRPFVRRVKSGEKIVGRVEISPAA